MTITYEHLHELFEYNGSDLVWKVSLSPTSKKGNIAGCIRSDGYRQIKIDGKIYLGHRLCWLFNYGYTPENFLDHINRNPSDNRLKNLREASNRCNIRNSKTMLTNTSGVRGVCFNKLFGKWQAAITVDNKCHYLCRYKDFDEVVLHRLAAEQCLDWDKCNNKTPAYRYALENKLIRLPK